MATGGFMRGSRQLTASSTAFKTTAEDDAKYQAALKAKDEAKKKQREEDIQDQERAFSLSKRGLDAKTDAQSRLQKEGVEGQSRLQRERTEQTSKLQTQAAAEVAARKAGDRAAAIANFRSRGGSKIVR